MPLTVGPLTREAFAPFGQVLMAVGDDAQRQEFAASLKNHRPEATFNMAFLLSKPSDPPWYIHTLERHPYSAQSFVPVQGTRSIDAYPREMLLSRSKKSSTISASGNS